MGDSDVRVLIAPPSSSSPAKRARARVQPPVASSKYPGRPRLLPPPPPSDDDELGVFEDAVARAWTRRWLMLHSVAIVALALVGGVYMATHTQLPPPVRAVTPILEDSSSSVVVEGRVAPHHVAFTLVPAPDSAGKWMKLPPQPELRFERLLHYDVCCFVQAYFLCRSATKNLAVEAYVTDAQEVVVHVVHPDMVGARCRFAWAERE
jgi:hypothetical protein